VIHDSNLLDYLSQLPQRPLDGTFFRATGVSIDPRAPSINGGRWSPRPSPDCDLSTLYTSFEREGALAELSSFLAALTPIPKARPVKVTQIALSLSRVVTLDAATLTALGVEMKRYGERDYARTQEVGAALAFLEADGLVAPSARWGCTNLMVYMDNVSGLIEAGDGEELDWRKWATENGFI
jgi:hypothetical protein